MIQLAELLAIAAAVALALAILIFIRRAAKVIAESRETQHFRIGVADLAARVDQSLGGVAGRIDAVRRKTAAAEDIAGNIAAARDAIVAELERAARALEMVDHGRTILTAASVRGREIEAQTAIKRGYLNVIHAREAIARHAARSVALGKREQTGLFERRA